MNILLVGLLVDWIWPRKESMNLQRGQEKLPKPKQEEDKIMKQKFQNCGKVSKVVTPI